jgi:hypothetical protein
MSVKQTDPEVIERRFRKTIAYLNSDRGRENWKANIGRGYDTEKNVFAAVQTATGLIVYERIIEIVDLVKKSWAPVRGWVA